jgi:hypothetical protein
MDSRKVRYSSFLVFFSVLTGLHRGLIQFEEPLTSMSVCGLARAMSRVAEWLATQLLRDVHEVAGPDGRGKAQRRYRENLN